MRAGRGLLFYANSDGTTACRERFRVCPTPSPPRSTDIMIYFRPIEGGYYAVLVGRGRTDTRSVPTCGPAARVDTE